MVEFVADDEWASKLTPLKARTTSLRKVFGVLIRLLLAISSSVTNVGCSDPLAPSPERPIAADLGAVCRASPVLDTRMFLRFRASSRTPDSSDGWIINGTMVDGWPVGASRATSFLLADSCAVPLGRHLIVPYVHLNSGFYFSGACGEIRPFTEQEWQGIGQTFNRRRNSSNEWRRCQGTDVAAAPIFRSAGYDEVARWVRAYPKQSVRAMRMPNADWPGPSYFEFPTDDDVGARSLGAHDADVLIAHLGRQFGCYCDAYAPNSRDGRELCIQAWEAILNELSGR